jgi:hypothetical protein
MPRPNKIDQFHSEPNRSETSEHAQARVDYSCAQQTSTNEKGSLVSKRRKRGEPSEQPGKKKEPRRGGKKIVPFNQTGEKADYKTTQQIDRKCAQRKIPRLRSMEDEAAQLVSCDRSKESANANPQQLFHKNSYAV